MVLKINLGKSVLYYNNIVTIYKYKKQWIKIKKGLANYNIVFYMFYIVSQLFWNHGCK